MNTLHKHKIFISHRNKVSPCYLMQVEREREEKGLAFPLPVRLAYNDLNYLPPCLA